MRSKMANWPFFANSQNRVFSILCHLHPTPRAQRPKEKCFPDHCYVILIWCTYIVNKTIKNGLLCLKYIKSGVKNPKLAIFVRHKNVPSVCCAPYVK